MAEVKAGDTVHLHYTGRLEDGTVFDETGQNDPIAFVAGEGQLIEGVDNAVPGLSASDHGLPMSASEDFAYFAAEIPAAYFFLGAGREGEDTPGCHHPDFDFDDELIPAGLEMFLGLVRDRFPTT